MNQPPPPQLAGRTNEGFKNTSKAIIAKSSNARNFPSDEKTQTATRRPRFVSAGFYTNLNSNVQPHVLFFGKVFPTAKQTLGWINTLDICTFEKMIKIYNRRLKRQWFQQTNQWMQNFSGLNIERHYCGLTAVVVALHRCRSNLAWKPTIVLQDRKPTTDPHSSNTPDVTFEKGLHIQSNDSLIFLSVT